MMKLPDFFGLKRGIDDFTTSLRETGKAIEALKRKREDVVAAPAASEDIKQYFATIIELRGQEYLKAVAQHLAPMRPEGMQNHQHTRNFGNLLALSSVGGGATPRSIDAALCCLMGPQLTEAIDRVIDGMEWPANAISLADRAARLEKIDAELDELLARERELVATARGAGLVVEPGAWDSEKQHGR